MIGWEKTTTLGSTPKQPRALSSQGWPPACCKGGYSLIEIVVIIIILSVVASLALPNADSFYSSLGASTQASTLVADIRLARAGAMEKQVYHRLLFSDDKTAWIVQQYSDASGIEVQVNDFWDWESY